MFLINLLWIVPKDKIYILSCFSTATPKLRLWWRYQRSTICAVETCDVASSRQTREHRSHGRDQGKTRGSPTIGLRFGGSDRIGRESSGWNHYFWSNQKEMSRNSQRRCRINTRAYPEVFASSERHVFFNISSFASFIRFPASPQQSNGARKCREKIERVRDEIEEERIWNQAAGYFLVKCPSSFIRLH